MFNEDYRMVTLFYFNNRTKCLIMNMRRRRILLILISLLSYLDEALIFKKKRKELDSSFISGNNKISAKVGRKLFQKIKVRPVTLTS